MKVFTNPQGTWTIESLPKPRQVEVAKALGMIAGDGTLLGR